MKAILEFNLPEDEVEFRQAVDAGNMHCVLFDFSQHLRQKLKYGNLSEAEEDIYEKIKSEFLEILDHHNIDLG